MIKKIVLIIILLILTCAAANAETPERTYQINAIEVQGNQRVDSAAILAQLKAKPGSITSGAITADVKSLYETGFFDQVSAKIVSTDSKKTALRFVVLERPTVRKTYIKGNEHIESSELKDVLKFESSRFIDRGKLEALARKGRSYYQAQGYYDAELTFAIVPVGNNQADVTFEVKEGEKVKIREIDFHGLTKIEPDDLVTTIQTKRYKWWSSWLFGTGRLNQEMLDNDKIILRQFLLDHGLVDGIVGDPLIERRTDGLYITFEIKEGDEYKIGAIHASGDLIDDSQEKTLAEIKSKTGEVFNASIMREDTFKVSDKFTDIGYAYANVIPDTKVNRETPTVDIEFKTNKGQIVSVNKIKIRGNSKTYDNVIRRELKIAEQEQFSSSKIRRSQQLLERLGLFEEISIAPEPITGKDQVDLLVNLREASTGSFSAGAGYSSSDGALFNTRLSENNLFGTGRRANINLDIGTERDNIVFSLDDRRFNDTKWAVGTNIYRADRLFPDFERNQTGLGLSAGYPLEDFFGEWAQDVRFDLQYEYMNIDIHNVNLLDAAPLVIRSQGKSSASGLTPQLSRNTINNPLNPTTGSSQVLSFEFTGLGAEESYYLLEFSNQIYEPLTKGEWGDIVFSWRAKLGYGKNFNGDEFPLYRRYFPGGINSIRGFKNRSLGPKDSRGNEFGGSKELLNNTELIFPLVNSAGLKGVIFHDIGNAFDDHEQLSVGELRQAWGFGLRWTSPLGPIRIEFGYPIDREPGEKSFVTMFSFGAPVL